MPALTDEEREVFERCRAEAFDRPLDYVRHDNDARKDDAVRAMVYERGLEMYGAWWVFVECLAEKRGHMYDVSAPLGWQSLAADMSTCGTQIGVEDAKRIVETFAHYGLIDRDAYDAHQRVVNDRLAREAANYAEASAGKQLGAWKTARSRLER